MMQLFNRPQNQFWSEIQVRGEGKNCSSSMVKLSPKHVDSVKFFSANHFTISKRINPIGNSN